MKITVVGGAGAMARAVIKDLVECDSVSEVLIADINDDAARKFAAELRQRPGTRAAITSKKVDVFDHDSLVEILRGSDAAIDTTHQDCGVAVAKGMIDARVNGCSLGSTCTIAEQILTLDGRAREAGTTFLLSAGAFPGATGLTAKYLADKMEEAEDIHLSMVIFRPISRSPALVDIFMTFLPGEGLVYEDGALKKMPAFSGRQEIEYPPPFGRHTVYNITSLDPLTLPAAITSVRNVRVKATYYPDYTEMLKTCHDLGLMSAAPLPVNGREVVPAEVLRELLLRRPVEKGREKVSFIQRVAVTGKRETARVESIVTTPFLPFAGEREDPETRATGEPGSIIVQMMARGGINRKGVCGPESCIDPREFMREWAKRPGVEINETSIEYRKL
ncbi:MAG: saccharopine dehydrogenase NADP-binding domain-containing protein [Dehalococcoidia bacterium]|nr:saccharopine dehydrogenase NADP-binding domain-containing protein [Dehalococcoidia bacterium]